MSSVSDYASEAVKALYSANILKGNENGGFMPKSFATRAETAVIINRVFKLCEIGVVKNEKFQQLFLCICLLTSSMVAAVFAQDENIPNGAYLLQYLKIMNFADTQNYWSENITRAEFSQAVYNIVKSADKAKSGNAYYTDIKGNEPLFEAVGFLAETGILTVSNDRKIQSRQPCDIRRGGKNACNSCRLRAVCNVKGRIPDGIHYDSAKILK
ncbi:MAG: S-layer homology domain-containing protein [Clostridiales bacterium]|nr:MAG: S-layer homology domain-containing protein [Clostridiales bacterium]